MKRKLSIILVCALALFGVCACSNQKSEEPKYADDTAMAVIAKGFEARADVIAQMENAGEDTTSSKALKKFVNAELDVDKELKDAKFKDSKMQEDVLSYINALEGQLDVLKNNSSTSDSFYTEWGDAYDTRSAALKVLVDKYDLTVSEKYQDDFEDLVNNGKAVTKATQEKEDLENLFANITFDKTGDGYDNTWWTYSAVVENTSSHTYKNVSLTLALYDADGVRQGETYASVNTWAAGEKVKVEGQSDIDAASVKVEPTYYEAE